MNKPIHIGCIDGTPDSTMPRKCLPSRLYDVTGSKLIDVQGVILRPGQAYDQTQKRFGFEIIQLHTLQKANIAFTGIEDRLARFRARGNVIHVQFATDSEE